MDALWRYGSSTVSAFQLLSCLYVVAWKDEVLTLLELTLLSKLPSLSALTLERVSLAHEQSSSSLGEQWKCASRTSSIKSLAVLLQSSSHAESWSSSTTSTTTGLLQRSIMLLRPTTTGLLLRPPTTGLLLRPPTTWFLFPTTPWFFLCPPTTGDLLRPPSTGTLFLSPTTQPSVGRCSYIKRPFLQYGYSN